MLTVSRILFPASMRADSSEISVPVASAASFLFGVSKDTPEYFEKSSPFGSAIVIFLCFSADLISFESKDFVISPFP